MRIYENILNLSIEVNIYNKWNKELLYVFLIDEEFVNLKQLKIII